MKFEKTALEHGDYRGYLYEAPTKSMPNFSWFFCPRHGLLRCLNNRWRCPFCNYILHQCSREEAFQLKHGKNPFERLKREKPKRHYHE